MFMRVHRWIGFFLLALGLHAAESSPLIQNPEARAFVSRNGSWRVLLSELNGNFLRLAHYPHNERIVRLEDERGILLWCEIPIYWNIRFDSPRTLSLAKHARGDDRA